MRTVTGYLGSILMVLGGLLLVPMAYALVTRENSCALPFLISAGGAGLAGYILYSTRGRGSPSSTGAMMICTLSWISLSLFGSAPFMMILGASPVDAVFETMSGFTTTGITMFTDLDNMPGSLILWRSLTQWIGGLGILTFFMAVASRMPGAHRLIRAESHKIFSGRPVPGLAHTVRILWTIYIAFTAALTMGFILAGMGSFDAVNHAMTTISTGGYSPHDLSMGWYSATSTGYHIVIEYLTIIGMIAGGTSFLVHYRIFRSDGLKALAGGEEVRLWWKLIAGFTIIVLLEQALSGSAAPASIEETFRKDLFQVTSIITTTGYATQDIASPFFGAAARQLFLVMMVIGGCVGSTSGGIKVLRISVLLKVAREELQKLFRAEGAISGTRFEGRLISRDQLSRIAGILFIWFCLLGAGGVLTSILEPELDTFAAFSGMFSALGNIGPCFISQTDMMELHWGVKITYIIGMLAGRLEIVPVMLLFSRRAWR